MNTNPINIGISESDRGSTAQALSLLLADTYTLYLKTHGFHWNVTGPMFNTLHLMFEAQYTEMWQSVDLIAERIRVLGAYAPGSYRDFNRLSSIPEVDGVPDAMTMVRALVDGNEAVVRSARAGLKVAQAAGDDASADLFTERMRTHEKTAWMLRSLLA